MKKLGIMSSNRKPLINGAEGVEPMPGGRTILSRASANSATSAFVVVSNGINRGSVQRFEGMI